jgi:hypothetical protein
MQQISTFLNMSWVAKTVVYLAHSVRLRVPRYSEVPKLIGLFIR